MLQLFQTPSPTPPDPHNESKYLIQYILVGTWLCTSVYLVFALLILRNSVEILFALTALTISLLLLGLVRHGHVQPAVHGWIGSIWLIIAASAWIHGGVSSEIYSGFSIIVLGSCLLSGAQAGRIMTLLSSMYGIGLIYAAQLGLLEPVGSVALIWRSWITDSAYFLITCWICTYVVNSKQHLFNQMQQQIQIHRTERDLLDKVMNTSVAAITIVSPQGQIIYANEQAEHVLGLTRDELEQRSYNAPEWQHTAIDGGPWPDEKQPFVRVMQTKAPVFDVQHAIVWPDKSIKYLSINGAPVFDAAGEINLLVFSVTDITYRYETEQALRQSEERYRIISETIFNFAYAYVIDPQGTSSCEWITEAFERMTGYTKADVETLQDWLRFTHQEDHALLMEEFTALAQHDHLPSLEFRCYTKSGNLIWLRHYNHPEYDPDTGQLRRIYGAAQDITQLKQLQEQLIQAHKMEAIGRLAGGIAHDFNNILTIILGHSALLLEDLPPDSVLHADVEQINYAAERASMLTRQLLAFSRQQVVQPHITNINDILCSMETMLQRLIGEDIKLEIHYTATSCYVKIDHGQLQQVMLNLVVNARDALPAGGTISIATSIQSNVSAPEPKTYVQLTISDSGIGMDEQTKARAFEPFFTTKDVHKGTGLGLSIVHGIIMQHGGQISIESSLQAGTTFTILLPHTSDDPPIQAAVSAQPQRAHAVYQVLVVEDETAVRNLIERVLEEHHYKLTIAADGQAAFKYLHAFPHGLDLLITDIVLPGGIDGFQVAATFQQHHPNLKILYLSGYIDPQRTREDTIRLTPSSAYLQKPFDVSVLTETVWKMLHATSLSHEA